MENTFKRNEKKVRFMKLSIIMPVYNEERDVLDIINRVTRIKLPIKREIIVVDDGSTDKTRQLLRKVKSKNVKIFFHDKNKGKGAAIRTGLSKATGDIITIQDADKEYNPGEFPKLLQPILKGKAMVVYGSRFIGRHHPVYRMYYLGNILLTILTNILYNGGISDMETCYKVFRRDALKGISLRAKRFDFEPEITAKFLKKGYKILELPISYSSRRFEEGKKITWKDGMKAFFYLIKYRFKD
jgi:glycosyltransferase involved in cell wall biosynthesis